MSPKAISVNLRNLFNGNGIEVNGFKIKADSPCVADISHDNNTTTIKFDVNQPRAEIKKFITLKAYIEQITFGEESVSIKLRNFPDLNFKYESTSLVDLFVKDFTHCFELEHEIDKKYSDTKQKEIAKKCLQYAEEWSRICMQSNVDFSNAGCAERKQLKSECYAFVKENITSDIKEKYSSVFLTFILISVVIPAIISWVVHRMLDRLFTA